MGGMLAQNPQGKKTGEKIGRAGTTCKGARSLVGRVRERTSKVLRGQRAPPRPTSLNGLPPVPGLTKKRTGYAVPVGLE